MASLIIDTLDVIGAARKVNVKVALCDSTRAQTVGYDASGDPIIRTAQGRTDDDGTITFDLEPNANIDPANTYYLVTIDDFEFLIEKGAGTEHILDCLVDTPTPLTEAALAAHIADTSGAHVAAGISVTAITGAAGDDVQEVLESLASAGGGDQLTDVDQTLPRTAPLVDTIPITSGTLYLSYMTATVDQVNHLQFVVGGTGAAATPSLVKFALFSVNENTGALTRVAVGSSAPILGDPDTAQAMQVSTVTPTVGARYALGLLVVTTEATPTMVGVDSVLPASIVASDPALSHTVTGLADMPSSVAPELLEATTAVLWGSMYYQDVG